MNSANCKTHFIQVISCVSDFDFSTVSQYLRESVTRACTVHALHVSFHCLVKDKGLASEILAGFLR